MKRQIITILLSALLISCGGGMHTKNNSPQGGGPDSSYQTPWGNVTITRDAFIFGSDYPSDIVIPDIDGMRDTAFVVSYSAPSGVLAIDLDRDPLALSDRFAGLISPDGSGFPGSLYILSAERAFLLTSSHVIDFNPTTGKINASKYLLERFELGRFEPISQEFDVDGDGADERTVDHINQSYPGNLSAVSDKLYITMSNYISPIRPAIAAPGTIIVFDILGSDPYLAKRGDPIITSDYNPTGVTRLPSGLIAITNSGVSDVWSGVAHPITNSSIDILDPETDQIIGNISLGEAALSFQEMAVTSDGAYAYIGSASFGEVYATDFINRSALYSHADPIRITGSSEGSDYLSSVALGYDNWYLFAASFDNSSIYTVDVTTSPPAVLPSAFPEPFVLGFPKGVTAENPTGTCTGVGAIAVRPGTPGIDFSGPDLFALTGSPGTLVTISTTGSGQGSSLQIKSLEILTDQLEIGNTEDPLELKLRVEFSDGTVYTDITDTLTNPYSGYPVRVIWNSSDMTAATVNNSGIVTPLAAGNAIITAQIGQTSARLDLTITEAEIDLDEEVIIEEVVPEEIEEEDEAEEEEEEPEEIVILRDPPAGRNAFADRIIEFNPGPGAGFGSSSLPGIVLGPPVGGGATGGSFDVLSLGWQGEIILEMTDFIIANGAGPDFSVFENAFLISGDPDNPYSEPAIVSVSGNGTFFREFACDCNDEPLHPGCAGTAPTLSSPRNGIDPTEPAVSGGNQFDLNDVGLTTARFVRIVDCGASGSAGSSSGFDLDAVAVVNGAVPD